MKVEQVCLDTDIIQEYLRNKKETVKLVNSLQQKADCATTAMNLFELFYLAHKSEKAEENCAIIEQLQERLTILELTPAACKQAAKLFHEREKLKQKPDIRNILVGVLTKQQKRILVTSNKDRYQRIPGLKIYK